MDELDRLYRRLVQNLRAGFPELLTRGFEVSQLYQQIVPYRTNRRELGFDSNEEYELAVMQLLAGLRGYLVVEPDLQNTMRAQLASPNPDLTAFRVFAASSVSLAPETLRLLERRAPAADDASRTSSTLSPSEQVALAGRATESFEATGEDSKIAQSAARAAAPPQRAPSAPPPPSALVPPPAPGSATSAAASRGPAAAPSPLNRPSVPPPRPVPPRRPTPLAANDAPVASPRPSPPASSHGDSCRYCAGGLPEGRRVTFCPSCGHNLTVQHCPACNTELEVGWKFCITCGREVGKG